MLFLTLVAAVAAAATALAPAPAGTCGAELELRCDRVKTNHTECLRCAQEVGKTHNCTTKDEAEFCHAAPHRGSGIPWTKQDMGGPCPITYPFMNETSFCLSVGKQRAIVELGARHDGPGIACAELPWRRDDDPAEVGVYVLGGMNGTATPAISDGNATVGEVCFETLAGIRTYAVYYLPFGWSFDGGSGSYHSHFLAPSSVPPALKLASKDQPGQTSRITARFVGFESITSFDERSPMEFMASKAEVAAVEAAAGGLEYLTWVSLVKNTTHQTPRRPRLPVGVARTSPNSTVSVSVTAQQPSAAVQVLLYAVGKGFDAVAVAYPDGATASAATRWTCLQTEGTDFYGRPMQPPPVASRKGEVTQLLFIVEASESSLAGLADRCRDEGVAAGGSVAQQDRIKITPAGMQSTILTATVAMVCPLGAASDASNGDGASPDGLDDIWRLSRMAWLNSKVGQEPSLVTRPYGPIKRRPSREGIARLDVRGRNIEISLETGLPAAITSNGRAVLANPIAFAVETAASDLTDATAMPVAWVPSSAVEIILGPGNASATWSAVSQHAQAGLSQRLDARLDFDGHIDYGITLTASSGSVRITKASLVASLPAALAKYADGAGTANNGGYFPTGNASALDWSWAAPQPTPAHPQPAGDPVKSGGWRFWAGDVNAGLFVKLKGTDLDWNRGQGGSISPVSWSNAGKGGIKVTEHGPNATLGTSRGHGSVEFEAFSGARSLAPGASVTFNFSLLATPVKGDYQHTDEGKREHYVESRHYHVPYGQWDPINTTEAEKLGANVVILHQSNRLNPYINYPFQPAIITALKEYIDEFAEIGVTVKMYYTIGQVSNHAIELFALAGLNGEVLTRNTSDVPPAPRLGGLGGTLQGNEWLEEHMTTGYEGEWFTMNPNNDEDAAVLDNTTSRFMNYYIEGQQWLFESVGVGGLYYDGFTAERSVQRRVRRMSHVAAAKKSAPRFDVHGRAFQNTELLPYVDSMWTCEGIDFTRDPGYWLVSISALPFGTFGEMLGGDYVPPVPGTFCGETCANRFRGMLYGMTNRAGWVGFDPNDNQHLWNLWDDFGIEHAHMYGYWNESTAVTLKVHDVNTTPPNNDPPPGGDGPVLATAYVRPGNVTLVAIASWSTKDQLVRLSVDWAKLGLVASNGTVVAPLIPSFNAFNTTKRFDRDAEITIPALTGILLLLGH